MSALLDFIVEHDDWEELLALKCVKVKHKDNLAIFNYELNNVGAYIYFIDRMYDDSKFKGKALLNSTFLINYHMMPFNWKEPKTVEKYKKIFGEEKTEMLIFFNECDRSC